MTSDRWMWTCAAFALMWGIPGMIVWPFLFLSLVSIILMLAPVGYVPVGPMRHDPDAWRARTAR